MYRSNRAKDVLFIALATVVSTGPPAASDSFEKSTSVCPAPFLPRDLIVNGGFEQGPGSGWIEWSDNFGTPLCNVAECGTGAATAAPFDGTWWAWFGGFPGPESSRLEQTVFIPQGPAAHLAGWLWHGARGNGSDYLRISIDDDEILFEPGDPGQAGAFDDYARFEEDLAARGYADGANHTLVIESAVDGPQISNFSVDDISLTICELPIEIPAQTPFGFAVMTSILATAAIGLMRRRRSQLADRRSAA